MSKVDDLRERTRQTRVRLRSVDDDQLEQRLDRARREVAVQRERLRAARRRLREVQAAASARSDRATVGLLRARGHPVAGPPVPPHPPEWLADPPADR